jgi:nucleotide-binding universal stress UspA family protein
MNDSILIAFEFPDPEPISPELVRNLASLDIVLLGHYDVPEQTPRDLAREEFGGDASERLDEIADQFIQAGASVRTRLEFGKDRAATIDAVAIDEECAAELDPAPTEEIDRILVPLPDIAEFDRLPRFVDVLCEDTPSVITLFHVVEGEENREQGEEILEKTREGLLEAGVDARAVNTRLSDSGSHDDEIIRVASEYDAVVMYEAESRLGDRIFGTLPDRIRNATGDPVIIVRRDY